MVNSLFDYCCHMCHATLHLIWASSNKEFDKRTSAGAMTRSPGQLTTRFKELKHLTLNNVAKKSLFF